MGKLDTLFVKIISDETFASAYDIEPSKYKTIEEGRRSLDRYVKAVAETLEFLNVKINEIKSDMQIRNRVEPVVLRDTDMQAIYRKIVNLLTK